MEGEEGRGEERRGRDDEEISMCENKIETSRSEDSMSVPDVSDLLVDFLSTLLRQIFNSSTTASMLRDPVASQNYVHIHIKTFHLRPPSSMIRTYVTARASKAEIVEKLRTFETREHLESFCERNAFEWEYFLVRIPLESRHGGGVLRVAFQRSFAAEKRLN